MTPLTRFQASGDAVRALADAGAPVPLGVAGVMPDRVVDHGERVNLARGAAVDPQRAVRGDAGLLARPHLRAAVRAERFDPSLFLQPQIEQDAAAVYPQAPGDRPVVVSSAWAPWRGGWRLRAGAPVLQLDFAAAGQQPRALAHQLLLAHVQRPERLPRGADLDERRARHQLVAEHGDVAPALQRP